MYVAGTLAIAALDPLRVENVLASAAGIVLECLPYLCLSALLAPLLRSRARTLLAFAGCGCGRGPGARSIPAALAGAWLFGPWIAFARVAVASFVAQLAANHDDHSHADSLGSELVALAPSALLAALAATFAPEIHLAAQPLPVQVVCGCLLGIVASPCALGGVALAASLHSHAPVAAYGVLATAGIVDLRRWLPRFHVDGDDVIAYALTAGACALVAFEGGARLVNPKLAIALIACIPICAVAAWRARGLRSAAAVCMSSVLLIVIIIGAPAPSYHATETTLTDAFAGESIDFTGQYVHNDRNAAIERFAITCCRADAAPVSLVLAKPLRVGDGAWVRVSGTLAQTGDRLTLRVQKAQAIVPPRDPFIYR